MYQVAGEVPMFRVQSVVFVLSRPGDLCCLRCLPGISLDSYSLTDTGSHWLTLTHPKLCRVALPSLPLAKHLSSSVVFVHVRSSALVSFCLISCACQS